MSLNLCINVERFGKLRNECLHDRVQLQQRSSLQEAKVVATHKIRSLVADLTSSNEKHLSIVGNQLLEGRAGLTYGYPLHVTDAAQLVTSE